MTNRRIQHNFRESLDVRDEESCYFEGIPSPNVTTQSPFVMERQYEPEFRSSIEFLGFGEGDLLHPNLIKVHQKNIHVLQPFLSLCLPMLVLPVSPLTKLT